MFLKDIQNHFCDFIIALILTDSISYPTWYYTFLTAKLCFWYGRFPSSDSSKSLFLKIKPTRCLISQIYFWNETVHVSDNSSVHHQEFFTVHTTMVYVIQVC